MEQKTIQEAPGTFGEAWRYGLKVGQELNAGRAKMREIIAQRLKECRLEKKITQQALALELSMNHLTYRGYENCKSDIPIVNLVKLADYFGVSVDRVLGSEQKEKSPTPEGAELDEETIELREIWNSADQEEREALLAMAKMLKARRNK